MSIDTVNQLNEIAQSLGRAKQDVDASARDIGFANDGTMFVKSNSGGYALEGARPTVPAFSSLIQFIKGTQVKGNSIAPNMPKARAFLQEDLDPDMRAMIMNSYINRMSAGRELKLRNIVPGIDGINYGRYRGGLHIRQIVSDSYAVFDAHHLLPMFVHIFDEIAKAGDTYKLGHCDVGFDSMHLRFTFPRLDDIIGDESLGGGHHSFGLYVSNGEIRNKSYVISLFTQRNSCMNSTVIGLEKFGASLSHRFASLEQVAHFTADTVVKLLKHDGLLSMIKTRMLGAQRTHVRDVKSTIEAILKSKGIARELAPFIQAETARLGNTQAGLANGFNLIAHQAGRIAEKSVDVETREQLEVTAGEIIMTPADEFFSKIGKLKRLAMIDA